MLSRLHASRGTGVLLALLLVAPTAAWIAADHGVWPYDEASYAEHALFLNLQLLRHPGQWWQDMLYVSGPHAPGIEWLGQVFVSLRGLLGSPEHALLLCTLVVQAAWLALVWASVWTLSGGALLPSLAACLFGAAAPLFVGLSIQFLTEPLQALAVSGFILTAASGSRWSRLLLLTALLFWTTLALLAKVTSPLYCAVPGLTALWWLVRPGVDRVRPPRLLWAALPATAALAAVAVKWYSVNLGALIDFARLASSSSVAELYGHRGPFLRKVLGWLVSMNRTFSRWDVWLVLAAIGIASVVLRRIRRRPLPRCSDFPSAQAALAAVQIALVLAVVSLNVNEDPRFIYGLIPSCAVLIGWLVSRMPRPVASAAAVLLLCQFAGVQAAAFGWLRPEPPWLIAPTRGTRQRDALAALVEKTADARTDRRVVFIAVELPWLNHASYRLEARKRFEVTGFMPYSEGFGYQVLDPARAFTAIENERPAVVVSYFDPGDPGLHSILNQNVLLLLERFRRSPDYAEEALAQEPGIRIFRHR